MHGFIFHTLQNKLSTLGAHENHLGQFEQADSQVLFKPVTATCSMNLK